MSSVLLYNVTSDADRVITGLGVFKAEETQTFGPDEAEGFQFITGLPLCQANVPAGVDVVIDVVRVGEEG